MKGFHANIEELTLENENFRQVLYTGENSQLVLMCLAPGEDIGLETHHGNDQFFRIEAGSGEVRVEDETYQVSAGSAIIVPAGAKHNVMNTSVHDNLSLYTLYSPPHHMDGIVRRTKKEAEEDAPDFDGTTTE